MATNRFETSTDDLTYRIIGCAMAGYRQLGPGLREDTYHRDLEIRLQQAGLSFESERLFEVLGGEDGQTLVGYYIPDFVVEGRVIVEIKALGSIEPVHIAQVIGYLAITGCPVGLLINFGTHSLVHRRIFPPKDLQRHVPIRRWLFVPDWLKSPQH